MTASCSAGADQESRSSLDFYTGIFGLDKSKIMELVNQAMEELKKMATAGEPLWVRSFETGRDILNYDEYVKEFSVGGLNSSDGKPKRSIEASRENGVVFIDLPRLVESFMDVVRIKIKLIFSVFFLQETPSFSFPPTIWCLYRISGRRCFLA